MLHKWKVNKLIKKAKECYFKSKIDEHKGDARRMFQFESDLMCKNDSTSNKFPSGQSDDHAVIADALSSFFIQKI